MSLEVKPFISTSAAVNNLTQRKGLPRSLSFWLGVVLTAFFFVLALVSLFWTPYAVSEQDFGARLGGPSWQHWLGTDNYGHDIFSQLMAGARIALLVGFLSVAIGMSIGTCMGLLAAMCKGWVDELVMRISDLAFAFPALLLAILLNAAYGSGLLVMVIAIGASSIPVFARIARALAMSFLQRDFILAARVCGKGRLRIAIEHVLPNVMPLLIVQASIQFAIAILAEAALSYLGLGPQYPTPTWGRMLFEAQSLLMQAPMQAVYPGLAIALAVLGLNLLGDGLRDMLDPRQYGSRK